MKASWRFSKPCFVRLGAFNQYFLVRFIDFKGCNLTKHGSILQTRKLDGACPPDDASIIFFIKTYNTTRPNKTTLFVLTLFINQRAASSEHWADYWPLKQTIKVDCITYYVLWIEVKLYINTTKLRQLIPISNGLKK